MATYYVLADPGFGMLSDAKRYVMGYPDGTAFPLIPIFNR